MLYKGFKADCSKRQSVFFTLQRTLWTLSCLCFLSACVSGPTVQQASARFIAPFEPHWQQVENGIDYCRIHETSYPLVMHCVRIDLKNDLLQITSTETLNPVVKGQTTFSFSKQSRCLVAINTVPFDYHPSPLSSSRRISGLFINKGQVVSQPKTGYAALVFFKDIENTGYTATVIDNQEISSLWQNAWVAFGGFWTILRDGVAQKFPRHFLNSRTAAGTAKNGTILYLLLIEGEFPRKSTGASFEETATIMRYLGAENALQLDGGSSSSMVISEKLVNQQRFPLEVAVNLGFSLAKP